MSNTPDSPAEKPDHRMSQGGNFWPLFTPGIWKVLHAVLHGRFLDAPRPYPKLADLGFRWTKEGSYWVAFQETGAGPVVAGIFYETADIPNRL